MLILFGERWNLEDFDEQVIYDSEYTITNRNGAIVFTLQKIPFPKFYLEKMVTKEEYEQFITYINCLFMSYNLGTIYKGKLGVDINFNIPFKNIVELCYQFMNVNNLTLEENMPKRRLIRENFYHNRQNTTNIYID